jgi:hypothetical protein
MAGDERAWSLAPLDTASRHRRCITILLDPGRFLNRLLTGHLDAAGDCDRPD